MAMREIKFRVWYIHTNRMVTDCRMGEMDEENDGWGHFMQYTGLKDKNGVEIYEGDIVSSGTSEFIVSFEDGSFVIIHQPTCGYEIEGETKRDVLNKWCIDIYNLEVIGNIYENKELLEQ